MASFLLTGGPSASDAAEIKTAQFGTRTGLHHISSRLHGHTLASLHARPQGGRWGHGRPGRKDPRGRVNGILAAMTNTSTSAAWAAVINHHLA